MLIIKMRGKVGAKGLLNINLKVSATICYKQNQNLTVRTGEAACQRGATSLLHGPLTSRDVIGLAPVTISLVTLCNCFLTVEDYT